MSQYKSKTKLVPQRRTRYMNESQQAKLVQSNETQRKDRTENKFISASTHQHAPERPSVRMENQECPGFCKNMHEISLRHGTSEDDHAQLTADRFLDLILPPSVPPYPLEAFQCGALEGSIADYHCGGIGHVPVSTGASDGGGARFHATPPAPISASPMPPLPIDDPFHDDWPHW